MIKEKITIYYDKECPFCNSYVGYLKIKDSYELILKNVREDKNIDSKFDINNGFIVNFKDNFFQGSKALEFLNSVVNKDTFLGKLHTPEQFGQPADLHPDTLPELIRTASRFIFGQF